jgi:hypothetical protein
MTMADLTIRPFEVHVPEEDLAELQRRIAATRWPGKETVADRPLMRDPRGGRRLYMSGWLESISARPATCSRWRTV